MRFVLQFLALCTFWWCQTRLSYVHTTFNIGDVLAKFKILSSSTGLAMLVSFQAAVRLVLQLQVFVAVCCYLKRSSFVRTIFKLVCNSSQKNIDTVLIGSAGDALLLSSCRAFCIAIPYILCILEMTDVFKLCSFHLQSCLQVLVKIKTPPAWKVPAILFSPQAAVQFVLQFLNFCTCCCYQTYSNHVHTNFKGARKSTQKSRLRLRRKCQQCSSPLKLQWNLNSNSLCSVHSGDVRCVWIMFIPPAILLISHCKHQDFVVVKSASNALLLSSCGAICFNSLHFVHLRDVKRVRIMFIPSSILPTIPCKNENSVLVEGASNALFLACCSSICIAISWILGILVLSDVFEPCSYHLQMCF